MRAVVRRVGGPERARRMVCVGLLVATIGLVGTLRPVPTYFGDCVEAFSASGPDWKFAADDCDRPPADVGQDRSWGARPSPTAP